MSINNKELIEELEELTNEKDHLNQKEWFKDVSIDTDNDVCWHRQVGVLISYNQAVAILNQLKQLENIHNQ